MDDHFLNNTEKNEAYKLFDHTMDGGISSWDYQMDFARIINNGFTIIPNNNVITNIGFGEDGTHTVHENDPRNKKDLLSIDLPLVHPEEVKINEKRDATYFKKYILPPAFRRFKNMIKTAIPVSVDEAVTPVLSKIQKKMGLN